MDPENRVIAALDCTTFMNPWWWLNHWGWVTHIAITTRPLTLWGRKLTIIGSDNGLLPGQHQAIIWTNAGILCNWTLRNKFQWNLHPNSYIFIHENAFENAVCEMTAILSWPQCVIGRQILVRCAPGTSTTEIVYRVSPPPAHFVWVNPARIGENLLLVFFITDSYSVTWQWICCLVPNSAVKATGS